MTAYHCQVKYDGYTASSRAIKVLEYDGNVWEYTDPIIGDFGYGADIALEYNIIAVGQALLHHLPNGGVRIFQDRWDGWTELNFYKHENSGESMGYAVELKYGMLLASAIATDVGGYQSVGGAWLAQLWEAINL